MKRFVTTEAYDGCIEAWSEQDDYKAAINHDETACWVWQFAASKAEAIQQHYQKLEAWEKDPSHETY